MKKLLLACVAATFVCTCAYALKRVKTFELADIYASSGKYEITYLDNSDLPSAITPQTGTNPGFIFDWSEIKNGKATMTYYGPDDRYDCIVTFNDKNQAIKTETTFYDPDETETLLFSYNENGNITKITTEGESESMELKWENDNLKSTSQTYMGYTIPGSSLYYDPLTCVESQSSFVGNLAPLYFGSEYSLPTPLLFAGSTGSKQIPTAVLEDDPDGIPNDDNVVAWITTETDNEGYPVKISQSMFGFTLRSINIEWESAGSPSGVETENIAAYIVHTDIYDLAGNIAADSSVRADDLPSGVYIIVETMSDGSRKVSKIVK